jgi:hypothetical protein
LEEGKELEEPYFKRTENTRSSKKIHPAILILSAILIMAIITVLVAIVLSSGNILEQKITNADAEKFVGTWIVQEYQETDIFYTSGRVYWGDTGMGDYRIEDGYLYIDIDGFMITGIYSYSFTNDYKSLILTLVNHQSEYDEGFTIHLDKQ